MFASQENHKSLGHSCHEQSIDQTAKQADKKKPSSRRPTIQAQAAWVTAEHIRGIRHGQESCACPGSTSSSAAGSHRHSYRPPWWPPSLFVGVLCFEERRGFAAGRCLGCRRARLG